MKKQTNTVTTETFTWDEESLRKVLAMAAGVPEDSVTISIRESEYREGLGGSYSTPACITLTRTMKVI